MALSPKDRAVLASPSPATFAEALAILHRVDVHRRRVAEEGEALLVDPHSELDNGERQELARLVQSAASPFGRRTFIALSLGWRRSIIEPLIPTRETQAALNALEEFFHMPAPGSDMVVWHNGFNEVERAHLAQFERGYSRMIASGKRRRASGKVKEVQERSSVDTALLAKMTGDYANTVLGFGRAFDDLIQRINRTPSASSAPSPPPSGPLKPSARVPSSFNEGRSPQNSRTSPAIPAARPTRPAQRPSPRIALSQPSLAPSPYPLPRAADLRRPSPVQDRRSSPSTRRALSPDAPEGSHEVVEESDEEEELGTKDLLGDWIEEEEEEGSGGQEEEPEVKMEMEVEMEMQQDDVEMESEEEGAAVESGLLVSRVVVDSPARTPREEKHHMDEDEPEAQIPNANLAPPLAHLNPPQSPRRSPRLSPSPSPGPPSHSRTSRAPSPRIAIRSPRTLSAANSYDSIVSGPLLISHSQPEQTQPLVNQDPAFVPEFEQTQPPAAHIPSLLLSRLQHAAEENTAKLEKTKNAMRANGKRGLRSMEVERGEETEESTQEPATDREPEASSLERSGEEEERSQDPLSFERTEVRPQEGPQESKGAPSLELKGKKLAPTPSGIQMPPPPRRRVDPLLSALVQPKTSVVLVPATPDVTPSGVDAPASSNSDPTSSNPANISDSQPHSHPSASDSQAGNRSTDDSSSSFEILPAAQPHRPLPPTSPAPLAAFPPILEQFFHSKADTTIDEIDPPAPGQVPTTPSSSGAEPTTQYSEVQTQVIFEEVLQTQVEEDEELEYIDSLEAERRIAAATVVETQEEEKEVFDEEVGGGESVESVGGPRDARTRDASSPRSFCDLDEEATGTLDDEEVIAGVLESTREDAM